MYLLHTLIMAYTFFTTPYYIWCFTINDSISTAKWFSFRILPRDWDKLRISITFLSNCWYFNCINLNALQNKPPSVSSNHPEWHFQLFSSISSIIFWALFLLVAALSSSAACLEFGIVSCGGCVLVAVDERFCLMQFVTCEPEVTWVKPLEALMNGG